MPNLSGTWKLEREIYYDNYLKELVNITMDGKWKNVRNENFDEYLREIGLNMVKRKLVCAASPVMEIKQEGSKFSIKTTTTFTKQEMEFTVGEPFETDMKGVTDGKFKCNATWSEGKLTIVAEPIDADVKGTTTIREIVGDELVTSMICGDVSCKRFFKKAE